MNIILSIIPKFAREIYAGKKTIEWRKTEPRVIAINREFKQDEKPIKVYLYETAPIKKITGFFILGKIHGLENPRDWPREKWFCDLIERGCVTLEDLKEYAGKYSGLYAWVILNVYKFSEIYKLEDLGLKRPPQSWGYTHFNMTTCRAYADLKEKENLEQIKQGKNK